MGRGVSVCERGGVALKKLQTVLITALWSDFSWLLIVVGLFQFSPCLASVRPAMSLFVAPSLCIELAQMVRSRTTVRLLRALEDEGAVRLMRVCMTGGETTGFKAWIIVSW